MPPRPQPISPGWQQLLPLLSVLLVAAIVLLYRLGDPALKNWDEAIYAEVAKEMLQTGDWLALHWQQSVWFEKPPLTIWLIAIFFRAFEVNEFWARAVSALSGIGVVGVTYILGRSIRGQACGLVAALILLTSFQFVQVARLVTTDALLLLLIYLAIYGYLRVRNGASGWWYCVSGCCALGFMTKSFAVIVAPAAIGLALLLDRQLIDAVRSKHFWLSILFAVAIVIPWHAAMYQTYGTAFVNEYFYYHVWSRVVTPLEGHGEAYWWYLREIWVKFHPWWSIAPLALAFHALKIKNGSFSWVLIALIAIVLVFYTAAQTKMSSYILPVYPALALLISHLLTSLYFQWRSVLARMAIVLLCGAFVWIAIGKIKSYYVKIEEWDVGVKETALLASTEHVSPTLILFSSSAQFDKQSALFYSNRRVVQATEISTTYSSRYQQYKPLAEVTTAEPTEIILQKDEIGPLLDRYTIDIAGESHGFVYATIHKK